MRLILEIWRYIYIQTHIYIAYIHVCLYTYIQPVSHASIHQLPHTPHTPPTHTPPSLSPVNPSIHPSCHPTTAFSLFCSINPTPPSLGPLVCPTSPMALLIMKQETSAGCRASRGVKQSIGPSTVVYPSIHPSNQPFNLYSNNQLTPSACVPTFRVSIHPSIYPPMHPSIHPPPYPYMHTYEIYVTGDHDTLVF